MVFQDRPPIIENEDKRIDRHLQLSDHFQAWEFFCHDGTPLTVEHVGRMQELLEFLERLRFGINLAWPHGEVGLAIVSGYRHTQYNKDCDGAPNSGHLFENGAAADVRTTVHNYSYTDFWKICCKVDASFTGREYRLGNYEKGKGAEAWVHIGSDFGVGGTRWFK